MLSSQLKLHIVLYPVHHLPDAVCGRNCLGADWCRRRPCLCLCYSYELVSLIQAIQWTQILTQNAAYESRRSIVRSGVTSLLSACHNFIIMQPYIIRDQTEEKHTHVQSPNVEVPPSTFDSNSSIVLKTFYPRFRMLCTAPFQ